MVDFIWLGRGGQGAFTASKLLGAAFALKGNTHYSLAFPSFGPERRGAPVRAFTKLDSKPILNRSETEKADFIIILDDTLYSKSLNERLKPTGKILINSRKTTENNIISFDAADIAQSLKLPTVNTVMLGALSAVSNIVTQEELLNAMEEYMPEKIHERNKQAVVQAIKEVTL